MDKTERRRQFIINTAFWAIIAAIVIFIIRKFINVLMPFVIAAVVSALIKPIWSSISAKMRISGKITAVVVVVLFYALVVGLIILLANSLFSIIKLLASRVPALYSDSIEPALRNLAVYVKSIGSDALGENFDTALSEVLSALAGLASSISGKLLGWATDLMSNIPRFLLNVLICIIATLFMSVDWGHIRAFIKAQIPEKYTLLISNIKSHFGKVIRSYAKSYAVIMGVTFMEVFLGTLLLGFERPILIGLGVAVFDILPILGSGMILIPWAVITLLAGKIFPGVGLIVLYCVIAVVRNFMEPRIIGKHVGLHPLVTLISMVLGTYIFGGIGLFGLPIALAVLQSLRDGGIIKLYNDPPQSET